MTTAIEQMARADNAGRSDARTRQGGSEGRPPTTPRGVLRAPERPETPLERNDTPVVQNGGCDQHQRPRPRPARIFARERRFPREGRLARSGSVCGAPRGAG